MKRESSSPDPAPTYFLSRDLFIRILGGIYCIAFISFAVQVRGLIGEKGILPVTPFLAAAGQQLGAARFWLVPTLCWFNSSDSFLSLLCLAGALLSLMLVAGVMRVRMLCLLWILYLSLVTVGQDFMEFQWDNLLLETGFLAIFLALSPRALWLLHWLLFRLMFSSGVVKLASGDSSWWNLTALNFHYETQPLPTWIGWCFHQLPGWFQKLCTVQMFVVELAVPFLIFASPPLRLVACFSLVVFQILIAATGNYCFFNLLAIALCLLLIDDSVWREGWIPPAFSERPWLKGVMAPVIGVILIVTSMQMVSLFRIRLPWPAPMVALYRAVSPFRSVNHYGLFAVMTTRRPEIILEGSNDGEKWLPYEFKWKPGDLKKRPGFIAPHQPRLDWQMWFAALGTYSQNPWFMNLMTRILKGNREVLALLKKNPFPRRPPRYLRAVVYEYRFTDWATQSLEHTWWHRQAKGLYCPVLSLKGSR